MRFLPKLLRVFTILLVAASAAIDASSAPAQSFVENTLYPLTDSDGLGPTNLVQAADGNFYGIATFGGLSASATPAQTCNEGPDGIEGCGTIFKITPSGSYSVLYTFQGGSDGAYPQALLQGGDGNLYGVAAFGGNIPPMSNSCSPDCTGFGTIFRLTPAGAFSVLYAFNGALDGSYPVSLIPASDGNFYGTTYSNTIFSISPAGAFTPVFRFNGGPNGEYLTGLLQASDGNLWGTTQVEGSSTACYGFGCGTLYRLSLSGVFSTVYDFLGESDEAQSKNGPKPYIFIRQRQRVMEGCPPVCIPQISNSVLTNSMTEGIDGELYGTTPNLQVTLDVQGDRATVPATIFKVSLSGAVSNLYKFSGTSDGGGSYQTMALAADGNLYGTSGSTVFQITPAGNFSTIYSSPGNGVGVGFGGLLQGSDGLLYSEAQGGGSAVACGGQGCGTVFTLSASPSIPPPIKLTLSSSTSPVGSPVTLNWTVANAFSLSMQQCYAFVQGGPSGAGSWTGLQPGTVANGVFAGAQTIIPTAPGTYRYALTCGGYESGFATLTVPPLSIVAGALRDGLVGVTYSAALAASSGLLPYSWTVTSGSLPPGLSLGSSTGIISGVPTQAGAATFAVEVVDSEAVPVSASATFSLTVDVTAVTLSASNLAFNSASATTSAAQRVTLTNIGAAPLAINSISTTADFAQTNNCGVGFAAGASCTITVTFTPPASGSVAGSLIIVDNAGKSPQSVALIGTQGLQFVAIPPCRVADTRNTVGPLGGPAIGAMQTRNFPILQSTCGLPGIPSTAAAYALNVTVVPGGQLNYLTVWPAGGTLPLVSLLNSSDGRIKANAAIIPAGASGAISVYAYSHAATNVVIDMSGYFVPATGSSLQFFPLTPCRIVDTRKTPGVFGGPRLSGGQSRAFPVQSSDCQIPPSAQAYSLNITAVPSGTLNYLTIWPTGQAQPTASTLNAGTGTVTANAAIVPAGSNGDVSVFVTNDIELVMDVNGYFAPPAAGGANLYTTVPCRMLDTRELPKTPFPGIYSLNLTSSPCSLSPIASALVLNATVVPKTSLGYLSLWPAGEPLPVVSTLNAIDGAITSNMAIVPTNNGAVDAYTADSTQLILDVSSYFAP
jgi:uncharacterized repeat protein (TIGR03803 family)